MQFRSVADLRRTIIDNLHRLPADVDLIVGIPRSGLLAATMIALDLNLPLTDVDGFVAGRVIAAGRTRRRSALDIGARDARTVLVIDDSVRTGRSLEEARATLAPVAGDARLVFCAIYGTPDTRDAADLVFETVAEPRIFEWNVMHHVALTNACVDIDGVLCHDPERHENDDGVGYKAFMAAARQLHAPTRRIAVLVTSRLERYRADTEAWLAERGILYDRLVMLDLPDQVTRRRLRAGGPFKGRYYRDSPATLFIESERPQAEEIARISGKPVLWIGGPQMVYPGAWSPIAAAQSLRHSHRAKRLLRGVLGNGIYSRIRQMRHGSA